MTSLAALLSMAPVTGGLTRAAGPQIALILTGALLGLVAVSGAVAVVLASAAVMVAVASLLVAVVDRFGSVPHPGGRPCPPSSRPT